MSNETRTTVKRRDFLKVLGAGGAAATAVGCSTEKVEKLIPYLVSPDQTVPGVSTYYATTCRECSGGCGVIAETRDGRTIKLEGNPQHPLSQGALCARGQSALQGLYNPDRFRGPMVRQSGTLKATTWDEALRLFTTRLDESRGAGTAGRALFINRHETGLFPSFLDGWLASRGMPAHLSYDALMPHAVMEANRQSYGVSWPMLDFSAARLIVSFGADFLDTWGAMVPQQLAFADARAKLTGAPRFIYVGPRRSLTGLNADQWIACKPGSELAIAQAMRGGSVAAAATASGVSAEILTALQREVMSAKPSLLLAGSASANARELATEVNSLNQSLGNVGTTVMTTGAIASFDGAATFADMQSAVERMARGEVSVLMVRGVDLVYTMPGGMNVRDAIAKVPFKVSFSCYPDETTDLCDLVLPDHHALEQWGASEPIRGTISLQQPTMDPVFDTRATSDILFGMRQGLTENEAREGFRGWMISQLGGPAVLTSALPRGMVNGTLALGPRPARTAAAVRAPAPPADNRPFHLVVYASSVLGDGSGANKPWLQELPDPVSKIAWQSWVEIHPLTAKRMGVEPGDHLRVETSSGSVTAPAYPYLGIREDTVAIALGRGQKSYGRYAKDVGVNPMAVVPAVTDAAGGFVWTSTTANVTKTGDHSPLVTTEGSARQHGRGIARAVNVAEFTPGVLTPASGAEHANEVAPQGDASTGRGQEAAGAHAPAEGSHPADAKGAGHGAAAAHHFPGDASHEFLPGLRSPVAADAQGELGSPTADDQGKDKGMYAPNHWSGMAKRRWAMTIDLARCTGCSACVTACYAENNIPTVGAPWQGRALGPTTPNAGPWDTRPGANILKGREMAWIRLERYYEGGEDGSADFETRFVPMLCQHCGNAPCEPVCPVYATYHSPDGLNVQVYNRCVGTRYCSNNCPYKVRYFNWFGYGEQGRRQYAFPEPLNWQLNPDVTVRAKGVMEKCSFCVQRIREAEHRASSENRDVAPDEFTVACAQACPSRAIVFGDAADSNWTVARQVQDQRAYHVFEELNTYTAVVYLKKVNHPGEGQRASVPATAGAH